MTDHPVLLTTTEPLAVRFSSRPVAHLLDVELHERGLGYGVDARRATACGIRLLGRTYHPIVITDHVPGCHTCTTVAEARHRHTLELLAR